MHNKEKDAARVIVEADRLLEEGDYPGATALYRRLHQVLPSRCSLGLGKVALVRKDYQAARDHLLRAYELDETDGEVACLLGAAYYYLGQPDDAYEWNERALLKGEELPDIRYFRALLLSDAGQKAEAEAEMRVAASANPRNPTYLHGLGRILMDRGKLGEALSSLRQAVDIDPAFTEGYGTWGEAMTRAGRTREALEFVRERSGMVRSPDIQRETFRLAMLVEDRELAGDVVRWLENNLTDDRDRHLEVAEKYAALQDLDRAMENLGRALELDPDNWRTLFSLGHIHRRMGNMEEARRCFERSIGLNPLQWEAFNGLGVVQLEAYQFLPAADNLDRAVERNPEDPTVLVNATMAHLELGHLERAGYLAEQAREKAKEYEHPEMERRAEVLLRKISVSRSSSK